MPAKQPQNLSPAVHSTSRRTRTPIACSAEKFSEFVGGIYDCILEPAKWEGVLTELNREFCFVNSVLGVMPFRPGAQIINVSVGFDAEWLGVADDEVYRTESVKLWGGADQWQMFPLDEPIIASQSSGFPTRHDNRYFQDILDPRGIADAVLVTLAREAQLLGYVAFNRHRSAGKISDIEVGTHGCLARTSAER